MGRGSAIRQKKKRTKPGTAIIPAFRRLRQGDHKFEASLGYIERPCLKIITPSKKRGKKTHRDWERRNKTVIIHSDYYVD
jgi:hypothetical protein